MMVENKVILASRKYPQYNPEVEQHNNRVYRKVISKQEVRYVHTTVVLMIDIFHYTSAWAKL
jgi:hypothetical protein